jgi:cysteine-rich repeat protein
MRSVRTLLVPTLCLGLMASCASDVDGIPMAINDPLDLIDDVQGPLRLYVLPAMSFSCDETTGAVSPDVPDVAEGMFLEAVADVSLDVTDSRAMTTLDVAGGEYVVFVRGKGTDPVSMRPDQVIARACAPTTIEAGETREVRLTLIPVVGMGVCGDGVLSPDEQCEDGNTSDGDGCSASCRTEPFTIDTTTDTAQENPTVAATVGQRWFFAYGSNREDTLLRLLEPDLSTVETPSLLRSDSTLDEALPSELPLFQLLPDAAMAGDGRIALAFTDFGGGGGVRVAFFNQNRSPEMQAARVQSGTATNARVAFAGDGAAMVVFEDEGSATGLSGQVFAAGSATPAAAEPFAVGQGTAGGALPAVAGASDHFVVAFAAGGTAYLQRFGTDGTARDAEAVAVDGGAMQDQVAVAALPDGRALVAWRQGGSAGDGAGSAVAARAFAADGSPAVDSFVLNTTTGGDQGAPAITAGEETFAVLFTSGGGLRARLITGDGEPRPNREQPPTTADFEVAPAGTQPDAAVGGRAGEPRWMAVWNEGGEIRGRVFPLP